MAGPDLKRRRIIVVEDEPMLALDIILQIQDHNGVAIGPLSTLAQGIAAVDGHKPDACITNVHLGDDLAYELADLSMGKGIPFIFASSEQRADIPERFANVPLHEQPIEMVKAAYGLLHPPAKRAEG